MKTILKWLTTVMLAVCLIFPVTAYASTSPVRTQQTITQTLTYKGANSQTIYFRSSAYHSGSRSSSSRVRSSGSGYYGSYGSSRSGFGSHMFSFGAGWLFGSMFHPFGGYYGYGYHSFSLFGVLFDVIIIWIIWSIVRRMFR